MEDKLLFFLTFIWLTTSVIGLVFSLLLLQSVKIDNSIIKTVSNMEGQKIMILRDSYLGKILINICLLESSFVVITLIPLANENIRAGLIRIVLILINFNITFLAVASTTLREKAINIMRKVVSNAR